MLDRKFVFYFIFGILFIISIAERSLFSMQSDTSMQISVLENTLNGMVLGVDVREVSTPMAIAIFLPGIFIGKYLGTTSETGVYTTCYLVFLLSLYLFYKFDRKAKLLNNIEQFFFYLSYIFIFIVYFQDVFAQREHFALMLMMPYLAQQACSLSKITNISIPEKIVTGMMMGIACAIKPYFLIVLICFSIHDFYRIKHLKVLFGIDKISIYIVYVIYSLWCYYVYPEYFVFMKDYLLKYYVIDYFDLYAMVRQPHSVAYFYLLILTLFINYKLASQKKIALFKILFFSSLCFYAIYFIQRRGYPYHLYPSFVLLFLAFILTCNTSLMTMRDRGVKRTDIQLFCIGAVFFLLFCLTEGFSSFRVTQSTDAFGKTISRLVSSPTMLSLNRDLGEGHPLVRDIKGKWVGSYPSIWGYVNVLQEDLPLIKRDTFDDLPPKIRDRYTLMREASVEQLITTAKDIRERKPDIILLSKNHYWREFVLSQKDIQDALKDYEPAAEIGVTEIWKRKILVR